MPREVKKMRSHNFYCPEELWNEMRGIAEKVNESDSEYIRKAIEYRNQAVKTPNGLLDTPDAAEKSKLDKVLSQPQKYPKDKVNTFFK